MQFKTHQGTTAQVISFPIGGIGTGSIGLSGTGRFIDWEIFNRPSKMSTLGYSHFAVKAVQDDQLLDARILHGDYPPHYMGEDDASNHSWGIGHGPNRKTLAGMPHFQKVKFTGTYPIATIDYEDTQFPGHMQLTAYNPFIPMNDRDSSIPAGIYQWTITNTSPKAITYTLALSVKNPFDQSTINQFVQKDDMAWIGMDSQQFSADDPQYGNMTIGIQSPYAVTYQENWFRGSWFDDLATYWNQFTSSDSLMNRTYDTLGQGDMCTLAVTIEIQPHQQAHIPFVIGWFYPNQTNYWGYHKEENGIQNAWRNYYAKLFTSSTEVVQYTLQNRMRLYKDTQLFRDTLFSSSLPTPALDAIQGNIAILKSSTVMRLDDGEFYGWEGVNKSHGSCEGSCTHVWNYAYALPFLYPKLERSMRELDYKYNMGEIGDMMFRLMLPLGRNRNNFRPCVDGQMGGIIKVYREWKISGDTQWLRSIWPDVKKSLEYAWHPDNPDQWDPEKSGVITGRQHHTLDMELFGPNAWLNGFYLAALQAASEMAEVLNEETDARMYRRLYENGRQWTKDHLFNGHHFIQKIDLSDISLLEQYDNGQCLFGESTLKGYWNEEAQQIKYQIGEGCSIDQLVGQWHARLMGLDDLFDPDQTRIALETLYNLNFKKTMRNHANPCRTYSLNDEAGIVICEWADPDKKPAIPVPYSEETMNGFEYAAACQMIQAGMLQEGEEIIQAVRDRYDGHKRNPWAEIECGNNYARSMASYAFLLTYSGFTYHMAEHRIGFDPIHPCDGYSTFWSIGKGWGSFQLNNRGAVLHVLYGELVLKQLHLPQYVRLDDATQIISSSGCDDVHYNTTTHSITFKQPVHLHGGDSIYILQGGHDARHH